MLNTKRLTLRPLSASDDTGLMKVFGDKNVMQFSDDGKPQNAKWIKLWVNEAILDYDRSKYGVMAVVEKESNQVIGYCGLFSYENIDGQPEVEIGYRLARKAWGHGYATEAAQALLAYAHNDLALSRIVAMVDPNNEASKKVAEKIGMVHEKDIMMPGYAYPDLLYVSESSNFQ